MWAPRIGVERACAAFGVPARTWRHQRQAAEDRLPARPSRALPPEQRRAHPARVSDAQREEIRQLLCSERFCDLAPAQIYTTLLDEGRYVCSERTMYRILHEHDLAGERRRGHRGGRTPPPGCTPPAPTRVEL